MNRSNEKKISFDENRSEIFNRKVSENFYTKLGKGLINFDIKDKKEKQRKIVFKKVYAHKTLRVQLSLLFFSYIPTKSTGFNIKGGKPR